MVRFSVIIPAYNSLRTMPATIASLLAASHRDYIHEIIVADSSDDPSSLQYLANEEAQGHIRLIRLASKTMPSLARNAGARAATSPYLVFVDSDVMVTEQWSRIIADFFAGGNMAGGGSVSVPAHQRRSLLPLSQLYLEFSDYIDTAPKRIKPFVSSCNLFCTKAIFEAVGGFPPVRASEDVLFCLQVSRVTELMFLPEVRVFHVFREIFSHFIQNQILIGKYVNIYRRSLKPRAFYLQGAGALSCVPALIMVKFLRIAYRIIHSNSSHRMAFLLSLPVFFCGLLSWTYGFIKGGFCDENV
ncbi:MAG TPA: glycosyltransferase [Geobacteraceae bacterium]|nr:glycosyltransferase [Geobacteraceae bacterium]